MTPGGALPAVPSAASAGPVATMGVYERALAELGRCATLDETLAFGNKAAALALFAARSRDRRLHVYAAEIRLRSALMIGILVSALDRSLATGHGQHRLPPGGVGKLNALRSAGLTVGYAFALATLAGGADPEHQAKARQTAEAFFLTCRQQATPPTMIALRRAVMGPGAVPARRRRAEATPPPPAAAGQPPALAAPDPCPTPPAPTLGLPMPMQVAAHRQPASEATLLIATLRFLARLPADRIAPLAALAATACPDARQIADTAERSLSLLIARFCVLLPRRIAPAEFAHADDEDPPAPPMRRR